MPLLDLIHVVCRNHQGVDDIGDRIVYSGNQLGSTRPAKRSALARLSSSPSAAALIILSVSAKQSAHHFDDRVQVVLDLVEIAIVYCRDFGRYDRPC